MRIKCYDRFGRLWKSKELNYGSQAYYNCIDDAWNILGAQCLFIKSEKKEIRIPKPPKNTVLTRYTGSDGVQTWTIPIRPSAYPLLKIETFNVTIQSHPKKSA